MVSASPHTASRLNPTGHHQVEDATNVKEVRAFLGVCGFYQRFIKNYAKLAAPLTELLKNTTTWRMGDAELRSIEQLKAALRESATLSFPDADKDYHI